MLLLAAAIAFSSLPPGVKELLVAQNITTENFPALIRSIRGETERRVVEGENEHLVFFVLQSRSFTKQAPIEPALSAKEFVESKRIPEAARRRMDAFLAAQPKGERMVELRKLLPPVGAREHILAQYRRTMSALYGKEFGHSTDFYLTRGHSTDTNVAANYAIWNALHVLRASYPGIRVNRVLIVGPGLDFAPRTDFDDSSPPQSYQPFAVADALLELGLSESPHIECIDINPRVTGYFERLPSERHPVLDIASIAGESEYMEYFLGMGNRIGVVENQGNLHKRIALSREIVRSVTAFPGNVVTDSLSRKYDLVVATNVLVYFDNRELLLAIANISGALDAGGFFVLNEIRPTVDTYTSAAGLEPVQARTLRIAQGAIAPLYDAFAIYRKANGNLDKGGELK